MNNVAGLPLRFALENGSTGKRVHVWCGGAYLDVAILHVINFLIIYFNLMTQWLLVWHWPMGTLRPRPISIISNLLLVDI